MKEGVAATMRSMKANAQLLQRAKEAREQLERKAREWGEVEGLVEKCLQVLLRVGKAVERLGEEGGAGKG